MKNSKPRPEYGNVYFVDKRTNKLKSKYDKTSRDLCYALRANDRSKPLSVKAAKLVDNYYGMISKSNNQVIFVDHAFVSGITRVSSRQNNRLHDELKDLFNIQYRKSVKVNGKKCHYGFTIRFTENTESILNDPRLFYSATNATVSNENLDQNVHPTRQKCPLNSTKMSTSIYLEEPKKNLNRSIDMPEKFSTEQKVEGSTFEIKFLENFHPLSKEDGEELQVKSGREFTLNMMNQILLDMSKRLKDKPKKRPNFKSKGAFMKYFSKCLRYEKRDAVKTGSENYKIKANMSAAERQAEVEEKYLEKIENSNQVSPEWHLKKKLVCVLERSKAYALLRSYKGLVVEGSTLKLIMHEAVELSPRERDIMLAQAKATHEVFEDGGYRCIEQVELIVAKAKSQLPIAAEGVAAETAIGAAAELPNSLWGTIRSKLIETYGHDVDKHWFSKLKAVVDEEKKIIEIKTPNSFYKSYVESNFLHAIERIVKQMGLLMYGVTC